MGDPPSKSQESMVIYISKPLFWQKHEMILWPIASICPGHFIENVREKCFFVQRLFSLCYEKTAAWNANNSLFLANVQIMKKGRHNN